MNRYKFKHPPIQSNLLLQYFVTNMYNTDLPGVNSKDLSESFCLITTKFFFTSFRLQMWVVLWKIWRHMLNVTHRHAFVS